MYFNHSNLTIIDEYVYMLKVCISSYPSPDVHTLKDIYFLSYPPFCIHHVYLSNIFYYPHESYVHHMRIYLEFDQNKIAIFLTLSLFRMVFLSSLPNLVKD